jgi:A nuclease family of the HNH/ENDO VII superfamily with conserved AHH
LKATAPGRALAAEMAAASERLAAHPAVQKAANAVETAGQKVAQVKEAVKNEVEKTRGLFESPVGRTNTGFDVPIPDRTAERAAAELYLQSRNAEILASNMEKAGLGKKPEGYATHHIVPRDLEKFPAAKNARKLLEEIGLDTNEAFNGVYLPQTKAAAGATKAQYHPSTHTKQYFINVKERLDKAVDRGGATIEGQRQEVIKELANIRQELENGTFPIR